MNTEKLNKALKVWQAEPKLETDNYHNSTGYLSNSFISDFLKCEYNAVIKYALKEETEENKRHFAVGHAAEAKVFEGEPGLKKTIKRYGEYAMKPPSKKDKEEWVNHTRAVAWHRSGDLFTLPNKKKPTAAQTKMYERLLNEKGHDYQPEPKETPRSWVLEADELAESILRHENLRNLFRAESSVYHQIITFELHGFWWRGEIDYMNLNKEMEVDLKTTAHCFSKRFKSELGLGMVDTFIDLYDYHRQRALYQEGIKQIFDKVVVPHICAVSKKTKSVRIFKFDDQSRLDYELAYLKPVCDRLKEILAGEIEPTQCEVCPECVESETMNKMIKTSVYCAPWDIENC